MIRFAGSAIARSLPTLVAAAVVSGQANPALAYVPTIASKSKTPLTWQVSNCIHVRPNAAGSADLADGSDLEAIENAVAEWRDRTKACSYIRIELLEPRGDARVGYNKHGYNENVIVWVEGGWEHDPAAAALTTIAYIDKQGRLVDADMELNGDLRFGTNGRANRWDIQNTVTHELGHVLGLDHPCDDGKSDPFSKDHEGNPLPDCEPTENLPQATRASTMFNFAKRGDTNKRSLEADDVLGICETYPAHRDPGQCQPVDLTPQGCACAIDQRAADMPTLLGIGLSCISLLLIQRLRRRAGDGGARPSD